MNFSVELRNRAAALELERNSTKFGGPSLSRSRSAQSLKLLGDTATQVRLTTLTGSIAFWVIFFFTQLKKDDKMTILAQLFWLAVSLLESDYEHEFLLACRLLSRVLHRLPLDRPDARDKVEKLQQQLKWLGYPGVHALLLKVIVFFFSLQIRFNYSIFFFSNKKGCTHSTTYEPTITLLSQLAPLLRFARFFFVRLICSFI